MEQGTEDEEKEVSHEAQLAQNTITHNSLIGIPQDHDNPYRLQEDFYFSHSAVVLYIEQAATYSYVEKFDHLGLRSGPSLVICSTFSPRFT